MSTHSITLNGQFAALTPQVRAHLSELAAAVDGKLWEYFLDMFLHLRRWQTGLIKPWNIVIDLALQTLQIIGKQRVN